MICLINERHRSIGASGHPSICGRPSRILFYQRSTLSAVDRVALMITVRWLRKIVEKRRPRRWRESDDLVASGEATSSSLVERGLRGRLGGKLKGEPRMRQILWLTNEPFVKVVHGAIFLQATRRRFSTTSLLHETPLLHYAASPLGRRFPTTSLLHYVAAAFYNGIEEKFVVTQTGKKNFIFPLDTHSGIMIQCAVLRETSVFSRRGFVGTGTQKQKGNKHEKTTLHDAGSRGRRVCLWRRHRQGR